MTITLNYTKGFHLLQKRLMCQPMSFNLIPGNGRLAIELKEEKDNEKLLMHLTDFIMETSFKQTIQEHMETAGYKEEFMRGYLSRQLVTESINLPWRITVELKLIDLMIESSEEEKEINLDTLLNFGLHKEKELIKQFAAVCDDEIEEELIDYVLEPFFSDREPPIEIKLDVPTILIQRENSGFFFLIDETKALNIAEYQQLIFPEDKQRIYKEGNERMEQLRNVAIMILIAKLYSIKTYIIPNEELFKKAQHYLTKYSLPTTLAQSR